VSRTPDAISKKRQELGRQLRVMELKLNDLRSKPVLTLEDRNVRDAQIKFFSGEYLHLLESMKVVRKKGEIYFKAISKLQSGVV